MKWVAVALLVLSGTTSAGAQRPGFSPSSPPGFRGGPGGPGGPGGAEIEIRKQFDKNSDGWLNASERKAARQHVLSIRGVRFNAPFGPGGRGHRGPIGRGDMGPAAKGETVAPSSVRSYSAASFYDEETLRTLFLTFENSDWEKELQDFHGTDVDVPATLLIDGRSYGDVGIRFRGMSSFMGVPETRKRSLNLSVDMAHDKQNVMGYRTLNLLNSHEDPTFMRAVLFLHVAREYIPAPKANFVRVVINEEDWGIYANVQQFNKEFLQENYKDAAGARWKAPGPNPQTGLQYLGENIDIYKQAFEIKTKDDPAQWTALVDLCRVLNETPVSQLEKALASLLDIDGALRFLALDNALVNGDGYWSRGSDYSLYRDTSGRFHIIPHDANETFAAGFSPGGRGPGFGPWGTLGIQDVFLGGPGRGPRGMGSGGASLDPLAVAQDPSKPLLSKLLASPALRERYMSTVRDIATNWLDWKTLGPLVGRYTELIDAHVKADTKKLESYEAFAEGTTRGLRTFVDARREFLINR